VDHLTPGGYFVIARGHGGHLRSTTTARLIWYRAHGPIPAGLQINHIDGVRTRDVLANLELATSRENSIHRDHVIRTGARVKLTDAEVIEIRRRLQAGEHPKALARAFGIGRSTVLHIRSRHTWRHL
jgi:HNH endonuclease